MKFYDKNGIELQIGDHIIPDEGIELVITSEEEDNEMCGCDVLIGQSVENEKMFALLTSEILLTCSKKE